MIGSVAGRHMSTRRRGSTPIIRMGNSLSATATDQLDAHGVPKVSPRRRRAVTTSDHKSCALIQTRLKLGDIIVWVSTTFLFENIFAIVRVWSWLQLTENVVLLFESFWKRKLFGKWSFVKLLKIIEEHYFFNFSLWIIYQHFESECEWADEF